MNFSQQSPKMHKRFSGFFNQNFSLSAPVHVVLLSVNVISFQLCFAIAGPSYFVLLAGC